MIDIVAGERERWRGSTSHTIIHFICWLFMFLTSSQWRRSKESTPYVGVSEWRCRKLKRERGRTCRSWNKEREEKGKNGNMESGKIGVHARRCCGHTCWCCRWQGRQNENEGGRQWRELRTMSNHDCIKTPTKMVGGYRRRWWSEKMVAEVEELRTRLKAWDCICEEMAR